ncbi:MAG: YcxB family protein [Acidobacteriales bacterium]|nr:YcxB family protein [Terriglobales bacterium]
MRLHPRINFEQYRDSCQALVEVKPQKAPKRSWQEYVILSIVCLVIGISPKIPPLRVPVFTAVGVLILYALFATQRAKGIRERYLRAIFIEEQQRLSNQTLTIDESGISCDEGNGRVTSHYTWNAFIECIDTPDAYLFLPSSNSFVRVPEESLSQSEIELLLQWSGATPKCER